MIIAVKNKDRIVVGISICDCSVDMSEKDLALKDNLPFFKVKGEKDCYVCTKDLSRETDLFRYNDSIFKGITDGKSVIEKVIPKMKELLKKQNCFIKEKEWANRMLIIKGNKIFSISRYFCVDEIDEFIGLGNDSYVLGALDATRDKELQKSILLSVRNASRMSNRCLFPITIFDTKTKRSKVFYQ